MFVELSSGLSGKVSIKYDYNLDTGIPTGTHIYAELSRNGVSYKLEGFVSCKAPDNFSRLQGRKWALVSLFKRDKDTGDRILTLSDKRELFELVCPKFFHKPCKPMNCDDDFVKYGDLEEINDADIKIDWAHSIKVSFIINVLFWGGLALLGYLFGQF